MANDSSFFITTDILDKSAQSPRTSSILFIRQFARVYTNFGNTPLTTYVMN